MKVYSNALAYLNTLNKREQWMVVSAALCVFIYIYYLFLYTPLSSRVEQRASQLAEKTTTLEWMNKVKQQKNSSVIKQTVTNSQLLTLLANQLKEYHSLRFPYQLQQTSSGEVQLSFDQVPFNLLLQWLANINNKYAINIKQFNATRTNTQGLTQLMIILSAAS